MTKERMLVWFSCGAASAVAAKVAVEAYSSKYEVVVMNVSLENDEHPDNVRFLKDVEKWIGQPILQVKSEKYISTEDVFLKERYIKGIAGAACTLRLKRWVCDEHTNPDDIIVLGFTAEERGRIEKITTRQPNNRYFWILADSGVTKDDCYHALSQAGIELPEMYKLGYDHNNCIGCVKGGMGYWNKIRRDFPEVFKRRAELERYLGYSILRKSYLDELDPEAGRDVKEPNIECGVFCMGGDDVIQIALDKLQES